MESRRYRAGESIEDYCRACKTDRMHTVMATDAGGHPLRVVCGYCRSEHNYRGGPRIDVGDASDGRGPAPVARTPARRQDRPGRDPFPPVSDRESTGRPMSV